MDAAHYQIVKRLFWCYLRTGCPRGIFYGQSRFMHRFRPHKMSVKTGLPLPLSDVGAGLDEVIFGPTFRVGANMPHFADLKTSFITKDKPHDNP